MSAALKERMRKRGPLDWAITQNNLGNALAARGERESGTARLDDAVAAYRAALEEWTRNRVQLQWAMTQNNLGNALLALGEREGGTARLKEAIEAYREALKERTRERTPLDAASFGNVGVARMLPAERRNAAAGVEPHWRGLRQPIRRCAPATMGRLLLVATERCPRDPRTA
jgi:tetratricopeptide (TPR) repeat protein